MCAEEWITHREAEKCDHERAASDDGYDTEYDEPPEEGPASRRRAGFRAGQFAEEHDCGRQQRECEVVVVTQEDE